ncbi:unnamed protein product [Caenorhabditis angaria]|uniref:Methyltransferase FkbM domain-containing protein n=1 Tax=Caenorhabditis angaria TaxID=860376 RepID=A0A9P1IVH1_9PELO|nr:unnamed protein product [Caenorhabditis angaria]
MKNDENLSEEKIKYYGHDTYLISDTPVPRGYNYHYLPECNLSQNKPNPKIDLETVIHEWKECSIILWQRLWNNPSAILHNYPYSFYVCDLGPQVSKNIPLVSFRSNQNDVYWAILPTCREENILVTLGVKPETKAEEELLDTLDNMTTFGTSPFSDKSDIYKHFKKTAFGSNPSQKTTQIRHVTPNGNLITETVYVENFKNYLDKTIQKGKKIDMLWINIESGDLDYWKYLGTDQKFDQWEIVVCQINIEVKIEDGEQFEQFMKPIFSSLKWMYFRPSFSHDHQFVRSFLLNVHDEACIRKYLQ